MNKKTKKITAYIVGLGLLTAAVVFFTYYKVDSVQVRGTTHYSDEEVKKMVLRGPLASNSVLAPMIYSLSLIHIYGTATESAEDGVSNLDAPAPPEGDESDTTEDNNAESEGITNEEAGLE